MKILRVVKLFQNTVPTTAAARRCSKLWNTATNAV